MASLPEVAKVVSFLASLYPEKEITKEMIRAYHVVLSDVQKDLLYASAVQLGTTAKFFPRASELRQAAYDLSNADLPSAERAWTEVCRQISLVGYSGTPEFSHNQVAVTVTAMGGWRSLCLSENIVADRAHFLKIYQAQISTRRDEETMHPAIKAMIQPMGIAGAEQFARLVAPIDSGKAGR